MFLCLRCLYCYAVILLVDGCVLVIRLVVCGAFICWLLGYCLRLGVCGYVDMMVCEFGGCVCMLIVFGYIGLPFGVGVGIGG